MSIFEENTRVLTNNELKNAMRQIRNRRKDFSNDMMMVAALNALYQQYRDEYMRRTGDNTLY